MGRVQQWNLRSASHELHEDDFEDAFLYSTPRPSRLVFFSSLLKFPSSFPLLCIFLHRIFSFML